MDWTALSSDPNDARVREMVRRELLEKRVIDTSTQLVDFVIDQVAGKRVLDIGVCEHSQDYMNKPGWRHARISSAASYCLGIDILDDLVVKLRDQGFNVRSVDATSEIFLGETFDVVFIGDVIEHVNNAVGLLQFAKRHLAPQGRILVSTPNPFSRKFIKRMQRDGTSIVNFDHVAWITPTMAMELGRRAELELAHYFLIKRASQNPLLRTFKNLTRRLGTVEMAFPDYLYEFVQTSSSSHSGATPSPLS